MTRAIPTDNLDGKITAKLALLILGREGVNISRSTLYRELRRRNYPLYRVGSTLVFHPAIVTDLIRDRGGQ